MSRMIIKKDNGLYAIWSSIVDDFIYEDITKEEYIKIRINEERERVTRDLIELFNQIDAGENPYYQFGMTYDEALKRKKEIHCE